MALIRLWYPLPWSFSQLTTSASRRDHHPRFTKEVFVQFGNVGVVDALIAHLIKTFQVALRRFLVHGYWLSSLKLFVCLRPDCKVKLLVHFLTPITTHFTRRRTHSSIRATDGELPASRQTFVRPVDALIAADDAPVQANPKLQGILPRLHPLASEPPIKFLPVNFQGDWEQWFDVE